MPATAAQLEWLEAELLKYFHGREDDLKSAAEVIGGPQVVQHSLDEWAYRTDDVHEIYIRTIFVWDRLLAGRSISVNALDAAWVQANIVAGS